MQAGVPVAFQAQHAGLGGDVLVERLVAPACSMARRAWAMRTSEEVTTTAGWMRSRSFDKIDPVTLLFPLNLHSHRPRVAMWPSHRGVAAEWNPT